MQIVGVVLLLAGAAVAAVGLLGWRGRLPRNRFAGIRTDAALRSDAAFALANRVAGPPALAAGLLGILAGVFAVRGDALLTVLTAVGAFALLLAGGLLGHRAAAALQPTPAGGCAGCVCGRGGCAAARTAG